MGIDYGSMPTENGKMPNRCEKTGIRYGIIPRNAQPDWLFDELEPVYSAHCPGCGQELDDGFESPGVCPLCSCEIGDGEQYADEADAWLLDSEGVKGHLDESGDLWITESPWKARAGFCSPCAPGAVYLTDQSDDAYGFCPPDDWYEDNEHKPTWTAVKV